MLYLVTGSNGAGKTLFTLRWVRDLQLEWEKKQGVKRPVYYDGFEINADVAEKFGWLPCDPKKWMELPDNSIVMVDECQRIFPTRAQGSLNPDFEEEIAISHRKRGFDFFLVTQHPSNISSFVRKLIGSGWHRHLKRIFGFNRVNCLSFNYAETSCEKPYAKKNAYQEKKLKFPKEVYSWYKSAELHTAKREVPKVFYLVAVGIFFALGAAWRFYDVTFNRENKPQSEQVQTVVSGSEPQQATHAIVRRENQPMSTAEYVKTFEPRIQGFPHTASRYDEITKPVTAAYPAACVYSSERDVCKCYTQQATPFQIDKTACIRIAHNGYFLDWEPDQRRREDENHDRG
jgi:zona occludens toxin